MQPVNPAKQAAERKKMDEELKPVFVEAEFIKVRALKPCTLMDIKVVKFEDGKYYRRFDDMRFSLNADDEIFRIEATKKDVKNKKVFEIPDTKRWKNRIYIENYFETV